MADSRMATASQSNDIRSRVESLWLSIVITCAIGLSLSAPHRAAYAQSPDSPILTWFDDSGTHKIEARFVKIDGTNVVLVTAENKQLNVPYDKLSLPSQLQARKLENPSDYEAPELPSSFAAPPLGPSPYPENVTLEQFLEVLTKEVKEGRNEALWYALTPEMQADVEAIVIKTADLAGTKFFKQLQSTLPNMLSIIRDKRSFILSNPRIARNPELSKAMSAILPATEPLIEVFTRPATWSNSNFQPGKVGPWLVKFMNDSKPIKKLVPAITQLPAFAKYKLPNLENSTYKILDKDKTAESATVEFESPNAPKTEVVFVKVGNTWLPKDIATSGPEGLAAAKAYLDGMDKAAIDQVRSTMATGVTIANTYLTALTNAKTPQEFTQLIDPWIGMLEKAVRKPPQQSAPGQAPANLAP